MYYVYILKSQKDQSYYTGFTHDLQTQIANHNKGKQKFSAQKAPYELNWYCVFKNKKKALDFEKYLKSGSGFVFARKRLV
jgi:predicted GIY-YIG superfamily endonuclease